MQLGNRVNPLSLKFKIDIWLSWANWSGSDVRELFANESQERTGRVRSCLTWSSLSSFRLVLLRSTLSLPPFRKSLSTSFPDHFPGNYKSPLSETRRRSNKVAAVAARLLHTFHALRTIPAISTKHHDANWPANWISTFRSCPETGKADATRPSPFIARVDRAAVCRRSARQ